VVCDPAVDPNDLAVPEDAIGRNGWERNVGVRTPRHVGDTRRHDLPNGVDRVAGRTELEDALQKDPCEIRLAHARRERRLRVVHRDLVDPLRAPDAFDLIACARANIAAVYSSIPIFPFGGAPSASATRRTRSSIPSSNSG
jgi:hypothetical protein